MEQAFSPADVQTISKASIRNILNNIKPEMIRSSPETIKKIVNQIIKEHKESIKKGILDYILLSKEQRERLKVDLLLREDLTSNEQITRVGGYSSKLYPAWSNSYNNSQLNLQNLLNSYNPLVNKIISWNTDFQHLKIFDINLFKFLQINGV